MGAPVSPNPVDVVTLPPAVSRLASLLDQAGPPPRPDPASGGEAAVGAEWLAALAAAVAEAARLWDWDWSAWDRRDRAPRGARAGGWADGLGASLLRTPAVEVRIVRWAEREGTRAHDHGGAGSALAVVEGELVEDRFEPPLWRASAHRRRLRTGTVVTLPADATHVLANPGPGAATSIHVVSPPSLPPRDRSVGAATFLAELCPIR
jgi:hypothetical protein